MNLSALERKLGGAKIPSSHPVIAWLVEHVADVTTKYLQGADGKTCYQRLFGKNVHEEALEFGERVMYKLRPSQDMSVVLDARWREGVWLGKTWGVDFESHCDRRATCDRGQGRSADTPL